MKRLIPLLALALVPGLLLLGPAAALAQKNTNTELKQARERIQKLEREVQDLKGQVSAARNDDPRVRDLERRLRERDAELARLRDDLANRKTGGSSVHSELFSFKSSVDSDKAKQMIDDANKKLAKVDGVLGVFIGRPQSGSDNDFDYAMVVILDAGTAVDRVTNSDAYKTLHAKIDKSRIYDFQK
jgi:septal ring factor EnvC (AmiA/AmiB activator)